MDMSIAAGGSFWRRLLSRDGFTSVSHIFVLKWAAVIRDIVIGLLIAGAVGAWVPGIFWRHLFLAGHPWPPSCGDGDRAGDIRAQLRLLDRQRAAGRMLWNGGISFGGVVAFIFADLISSGSWSSTGGTTAPG
jgi:uncharacterized membrane protein YraQ (UPF0718 family)